YIVPIPGSRKIERLQENANALTISFSQEEMQEIENSINELKAVVFSGLPKSLEKRWDS
ncbi:MAG: aldo/keto reductase, partial [Synergistaceae bacterium]|nr:aldo/keto reductase [Synergistaceae bacterium]